ncbi:MAG: cell division protein ZapA [Candidatus Dependentiae bacterium]|nr:cell division protein ZapA [Candidatus Dependentiae bacterium]
MIREVEQVTVSIAGDSYTVISDEGRLLLNEAAGDVDALIKQIASRSLGADARRVAVFAALKLAHELRRAQQALDSHQQHALSLVSTISDEL